MRKMAGMETHVPPPVPHAHRRSASRLRTSLPARLTDVTSSYGVRLEDLSRSGARISVPASKSLHPGEFVVLRWAGFERFGEIVWVAGECGGILFDHELDDSELMTTRHMQDNYSHKNVEHLIRRKAAREWVSGHGH
jgi:hypothetical protein